MLIAKEIRRLFVNLTYVRKFKLHFLFCIHGLIFANQILIDSFLAAIWQSGIKSSSLYDFELRRSVDCPRRHIDFDEVDPRHSQQGCSSKICQIFLTLKLMSSKIKNHTRFIWLFSIFFVFSCFPSSIEYNYFKLVSKK